MNRNNCSWRDSNPRPSAHKTNALTYWATRAKLYCFHPILVSAANDILLRVFFQKGHTHALKLQHSKHPQCHINMRLFSVAQSHLDTVRTVTSRTLRDTKVIFEILYHIRVTICQCLSQRVFVVCCCVHFCEPKIIFQAPQHFHVTIGSGP